MDGIDAMPAPRRGLRQSDNGGRSGLAVESGSSPMSFAWARDPGLFYFAAWAANFGRYQLLRCFALNRFLTHDYTITPALHVSMPECS